MQNLLSDTVFGLKVQTTPKSAAVGALPRTPLGDRTAIHQTLWLVGRGLAAPRQFQRPRP